MPVIMITIITTSLGRSAEHRVESKEGRNTGGETRSISRCGRFTVFARLADPEIDTKYEDGEGFWAIHEGIGKDREKEIAIPEVK
ncbi:hypothetical protein PoB_004536700 [Plakobranchus ocellatus]|uniref:Uncharacterized protein n=1 Tax=Plakobranchus ocellatus TaxID=259542 RepID=A0AAV4BHL3_9GAST|nr:hypothetical protein PoB_004536700 [Plakobranchus ocellatus]